jgi:aspartate aminotransferase
LTLKLAARMGRMSESATAAMFRRVAELRQQGVDVISMAVGEPDAAPPDFVRAAMKRAIDEGAHRYTEVAGLRSLREAILADSLRRRGVGHQLDEVVVSAGAKHTLFNIAEVLFDHGDEVVIPTPAWVSYADQARLCGALPVLVPCAESDRFLVQPEALANAINARTKAVVLCTPSNPTGAAYDAAALERIAEVLRKTSALAIVDEIYGELLYDGRERTSLLTVAPDLRERIAIVDGVSKRFAMTGYRVGWGLMPRALARACEVIQSQATTNISAPAQLAAQAALKGPDAGDVDASVRAMRDDLASRRDYLLRELSKVEGLRVPKPDGAFYLFVSVHGLLGPATKRGFASDVAVAEYLLDVARVATVPGSAFHAPGYLRLSYATAQRDLERAVVRIQEAVAALRTA